MLFSYALLGLLIGSFINVLVYRIPQGRSIVRPPSACSVCTHPIRRRDNVPVLSWLILRGRCRDCAAPISMRYPLVELGCAVFFVAVGARFMPATIFTAPLNELIADLAGELAFFYLATISLTLALIDVDHRRLPNVLVLPAYAVGFVLLTIASIARGEVVPLAVALMSSVGLFVFYFILMIASRSGMGFGDVKLAGVIGLFTGYLGISVVLVATMAAFILGGLYGVGLILTRRAGRKTGVPFGPWMLAGAWLAIFWGTDIAAAYLRLFGLGES